MAPSWLRGRRPRRPGDASPPPRRRWREAPCRARYASAIDKNSSYDCSGSVNVVPSADDPGLERSSGSSG